jgi:hypothetical protein
MRRHLSYANVMATLAFFFALTGGAMAVGKYVMTTDPIPATSDLTGTYGNPLIADGKVTTPKLADGAVTTSKFAASAKAPDADKLDGKDSTGFPLVVARGKITVLSPSTVNPGSCVSYSDVLAPPEVDPATDLMVVQPPNAFTQMSVNGYIAVPFPGFSNQLWVRVCNGTDSQHDAAGDYGYLVLR